MTITRREFVGAMAGTAGALALPAAAPVRVAVVGQGPVAEAYRAAARAARPTMVCCDHPALDGWRIAAGRLGAGLGQLRPDAMILAGEPADWPAIVPQLLSRHPVVMLVDPYARSEPRFADWGKLARERGVRLLRVGAAGGAQWALMGSGGCRIEAVDGTVPAPWLWAVRDMPTPERRSFVLHQLAGPLGALARTAGVAAVDHAELQLDASAAVVAFGGPAGHGGGPVSVKLVATADPALADGCVRGVGKGGLVSWTGVTGPVASGEEDRHLRVLTDNAMQDVQLTARYPDPFLRSLWTVLSRRA